MLFFGVIDNDKHKLLWCKMVQALGSMSETLKMTITRESLILKAINSSRTCHGEIIFSKDFFHVFELDIDEDTLTEGWDGDAYHLLVNSKHLLTIFRHPDTWEYLSLRINMSFTAQPAARFKLLVEIRTANLIVKKFQNSYNPTISSVIKVGQVYHEQLDHQKENFDNAVSIHNISMELRILKSFLETIASGTEDFRLQVKPDKIQITAYTRQITRNKDYLKQPMSVSLDIPLSELADSNLVDHNVRSILLIRLKEVKTFNHLANSLHTLDADFEDSLFHMLFRNPGEPIVFEAKHKNLISVQFVQLSTPDREAQDEEQTLVPEPLNPSLFDLRPFAPATHKGNTNSIKRPHEGGTALMVTSKAASGPSTVSLFQKTISPAAAGNRQVRNWARTSSTDLQENESDVDHVTHARRSTPDWGNYGSQIDEGDEFPIHNIRKRTRPSKDSEPSPNTRTGLNLTRARKQEHLETNEEYGPTQNNKRPKSILD